MPLQEEIAQLLTLPEKGAGAPTLATLERRLTDGYAEALALEGERLRIERRLGEVVRDADETRRAQELTALSARLASADGELARLRPLLRTLQARARARRLSR